MVSAANGLISGPKSFRCREKTEKPCNSRSFWALLGSSDEQIDRRGAEDAEDDEGSLCVLQSFLCALRASAVKLESHITGRICFPAQISRDVPAHSSNVSPSRTQLQASTVP